MLQVTYNWEEEDAEASQSTAPKREQIAPDVFLYTTRRDNPTSFIYHLDCMKDKQVRLPKWQSCSTSDSVVAGAGSLDSHFLIGVSVGAVAIAADW